MFDFDPRDYDSRDDERQGSTPNRGDRGAFADRDRDDDWRQPDFRPGDGDDEDARTLGRGPGSDREASDEHGRDRRDDAVGPTGTATVVSAIGSHGTRSRNMSTCRADWSASWFATAIASTPSRLRIANARNRWRVPSGLQS